MTNQILFSKGQKVAVLDDALEGVVINSSFQEVTIETTEGFILNFKPNELILMDQNGIENVFKNVSLQTVLKEKQGSQRISKQVYKSAKKDDFAWEVDLHIEKLVPSIKGLNNYDILTIQLDTAKRQIDAAIKNRIPRLVLIHGVGEGVLKSELDYLLGRYDNLTFQDGNYQKYGLGATEVYFIQKML
jgi:dsDNA-specific endonuclease/ATPase MutS2